MVPKLRITAIKPYPVWVGTRNQLIVKVETDQGVYGWGESGLSSREKAVVAAGILIAGMTGMVDRWRAGDPRELLEETYVEVVMGALRSMGSAASR